MKQYLSLLLCICLLLAGCANSAEDSDTQPTTSQSIGATSVPTKTESPMLDGCRIPTVEEDFWELLCENCDITVYRLSGGQRFLSFQLVSARDLTNVPITITSDLGGSDTLNFTLKEEPTPLTGQVFLAYQGEDWAAFEGDWERMRKRYEEIESALAQAHATLPQLYSYVIQISLYDMGMEGKPDENGYLPSEEVLAALPPQQIETLTVTIGEQTKTYDLDNVQILSEEITVNENYRGGISVSGTMGIMDYAAWPSGDGALELPELRYDAKADVVMESFTVPGAEVVQCDVRITTALGDQFNFRWDCASPIEVDEGSVIILENVVVRDPALANTLFANIWRNQMLTYTNNSGGEYDGQEFTVVVPVSIRMRVDAWDAYARYVDGVDMLSYYLDYKNYKEQP